MKTRNREIDIMKGLLTLAMILCHCIQFFGNETKGLQKVFADLINLTTFSGFLFCFGYVSELAYYQKDFKVAAWKAGKNIVRMLAAFYISGLAYIAFVERKKFIWGRVTDVLLLKTYPGWSEFLASFAAVLFIGILLYPVLKRMNGKMFLTILVISVLSCKLIPYDKIQNSWLALMVGSVDHVTFPVLQYGIFFAAGIWFAKEKISWNKRTLFGAMILGIPFVLYYVKYDCLPGRFPPDSLFILGGVLGVYLYRMLSLGLKALAEKNGKWESLILAVENVGMNSMFYLLFSNLLIFALAGSKFAYPSENFAYAFFIIVLFIIYYLRRLIRVRQ